MLTTAERLLETLAPLVERTPGALFAFDADGTLWSGDVAEDVFHHAVEQRLLRADAHTALVREAEANAIDAHGDASEIAGRLFKAYLAGAYSERSTCAMLAWCYAGFSYSELAELAQHVFQRRKLAERLQRELEPILSFARRAGVRVAVVSASPRVLVREAVSLWGIDGGSVTATCAAQSGETILDHLACPVPYAEAKPHALRELVPEGELLASFGDSAFDVELLRAAHIGVAVRPKPALRARLPELSGILVLESVA